MFQRNSDGNAIVSAVATVSVVVSNCGLSDLSCIAGQVQRGRPAGISPVKPAASAAASLRPWRTLRRSSFA